MSISELESTKFLLDLLVSKVGTNGVMDAAFRVIDFDLLKTKESGLKGAIGELIAWTYLRRHNIWAYSLAATYPAYHFSYPRVTRRNYTLFGLDRQQIEYLKTNIQHGPRRWDFVAIHRDHSATYLVEVKTVGTRKDVGTFRSKLPTPNEITKAKLLGFKPLVVRVELNEHWNFRVRCFELSALTEK